MATADGLMLPAPQLNTAPKSPRLYSVISDLSSLDISSFISKVPLGAEDGKHGDESSQHDMGSCQLHVAADGEGTQHEEASGKFQQWHDLIQSKVSGAPAGGSLKAVKEASVTLPSQLASTSQTLQEKGQRIVQEASGNVRETEAKAAESSPARAKEPVTCHVSSLSWAGSKEGFRKTNQDAYCYMRTKDKRSLLFGVFDGHGPRGRDASQLVKQRLPELLMSQQDGLLLANTPRAFELSFPAMQQEIVSNSEFDCGVSGTTAVMAHVYQRRLTVAWTGDSRAVLAKSTPSGEVIAVELSSDHKPEKEQEKERIESSNGRVYRDVNEYGDDVGPFRVWMRQGPMLGLAMSRSLGDRLAHTVGVSCTPEVKTFSIEPEDRFMILASDGVWEFVSSTEAVKIVQSCPNPNLGVKKLLQHAKAQWLKQDLGAYVDDITALVVALKHNEDWSPEVQ